MKSDRSLSCMRNRWLVGVLVLFFSLSCTTTNSEIRRKQAEASRQVGEAYLGQGDYTLALREFLDAEKLFTRDPLLHNDLGLTYRAKDELDLAIDHFKKAIEIKPDYAPARNNLGTVYLAKEEWDEAIKCFRQLTGDLLYATPHYPLSNMGFAYYKKKAYPRAEEFYLDALKIQPGFVYALRGLSKTYVAMERIADAVETLEKAVRALPRSPQLYFDLAHVYELSRDYSKARHAYDKVVELAPETPLAVEAKKAADNIR